MKLLQAPLLDNSFWPLLLALAIFAAVTGGYLRWIIHRRNVAIEQIDRLMLGQISISLTEVISKLDLRRVDRKTLLGLVRRATYGLLSFSKTSVVSSPLLSSKLKEDLKNNSIIHVDKEAIRWDLAPSAIADLVTKASEQEGLDTLLTKDGDILLVPDLKDRIKESLELQGRVDIVAEAQRLRVDIDEIVKLVKSWGWYVWQSSTGAMYSVKWLLGTLERSVARQGYLDLDSESTRLDLAPEDILSVVRLYNWNFVEAYDGRIIPEHALQTELLTQLDKLGSINLVDEASRHKMSTEALSQVLRKLGLTLITTTDGSIMTLEQLRQELVDDVELAGIISGSEVAQRVGIEPGLADRVLANHAGIRKAKDGKYISYKAIRSWILDEVQRSGTINVEVFMKRWTLNRIELAALLKRFGFHTVLTKSGNYLSTTWVARKIGESLNNGESIDPEGAAQKYDVDVRAIESIISTSRTDTLVDGKGRMISRSSLRKELELQFHKSGILRPYEIAAERGLDITDIEKTIQPLRGSAFETWENELVDKTWYVRKVRDDLKKLGFFDLDASCEKLQLNLDEVSSEVQARLDADAQIVEGCEVVVSSDWVRLLRMHIQDAGHAKVAEFAKQRGLSSKTAICLLRELVQGIYLPSTDTYFTKS
jgi:hypothetical protein